MSKFSKEEIEFLEANIELKDDDGLKITGVKTIIWGDVDGGVAGNIKGDVGGTVEGSVGEVTIGVVRTVGGLICGKKWGYVDE